MTAQTGLRISEICSLTHDDIHLGTGAHIACTDKGRRQRITPLTRATVSTMTTYCARPVDAVSAVAAHQAQQPVDGAHPGPGQRVIEDAFGVDPDVRAVSSAAGDQRR